MSCGTFGEAAYRFADFLYNSGFRLWQVLPFNIPHADGSPYSSASTFALNPLFLDPEILQEKGLLRPCEVDAIRQDASRCKGNYHLLAKRRETQLRMAAKRIFATPEKDAVLDYVNCNPYILQACRYLSKDRPSRKNLFYYGFLQYEFHRQWDALHKYLRKKGIAVIGDIPIYVNQNSSEVYYNPEYFRLNSRGRPEFVSGVPGDSFSDAGQKWGHPLYDTAVMQARHYDLLFDRMAFAASLYDLIRIDHFQAIAMYYAIPAKGHPRDGHWEKGVGEPFVRRLVEELGKERFIVEDFNCFPGGSYDLAMQYGFPDMNTFQFTLASGKTAEDYPKNTVAYLGTHDISTFRGFLDSLSAETLRSVAGLLGGKPEDKEALCRLAIAQLLKSPAERVILQVQDLLYEGDESRMNIPGISGHGNWLYRITDEKLCLLESSAAQWQTLLSQCGR